MQFPNQFKVAICQLAVGLNKKSNLMRASAAIEQASKNHASLVILPECFNSEYQTSAFRGNSEKVPGGPSTEMLSKLAKDNNVYLVGGSIPEIDDDKIYNCSTVFSPKGELLAKYRKMHLFDIDVPGGVHFKESEVLSPGSSFCTFETPWAKVGLGICYDVRFPELAHELSFNQGAKLLIYPGAFNMTTGPLHWEILARARAVDQQVFVALASPARDPDAKYVAWGHSMVVDPWGKIIAELKENEDILYADIDLSDVDTVRSSIPCLHQKRLDMYSLPKAHSDSSC